MKKLKTTYLALGLGMLVLTLSVFAADNVPAQNPPSGSTQNEMGQGFIFKYGRLDLTDADKSAIANIMKTHGEIMMSLAKNNGDIKLSGSEIQVKMQAEQEKFINDLLPYAAEDKKETFKADMAPRGGKKPENGTNIEKGSKNNLPNKPIPNTNIKQNSILPAGISKTIDNKLAMFSSDDDKINWLNSVNAKIDTLISKLTSSKTKNLLNALKDLINEKIDTINGNLIDSSMIDDLLK